MIEIRRGAISDLPRALELIKELAEYENALSEVANDVERMRLDGFGESPGFGFFIAARESLTIGIAFYYYRYSTWKGKRLYLEDIVVTNAERGRGVGKLLFEEVMKKALADNCTGMMWQVLEWNKPAIGFYKKYDAKLDNEWINCSLEASQIRKILVK